MSTDEAKWRIDDTENGWALPAPAHRLKRLPVIRHVRALLIGIQVERHYAVWASVGMIRTGYDEWVLYAIRRGWC